MPVRAWLQWTLIWSAGVISQSPAVDRLADLLQVEAARERRAAWCWLPSRVVAGATTQRSSSRAAWSGWADAVDHRLGAVPARGAPRRRRSIQSAASMSARIAALTPSEQPLGVGLRASGPERFADERARAERLADALIGQALMQRRQRGPAAAWPVSVRREGAEVGVGRSRGSISAVRRARDASAGGRGCRRATPTR